uniref:6,7-dimethyl-8-ribityllumazine synthase n=1 Tax=Eucampia antarctica TaxID=49252 RepID=A0A7S2S1K9_9STRA|mmetsp:Transcript_29735/g.28594  ORF Transcript_29735/g.28594 Transcript_29735/m.28594 type:complete len:225 (+) Transcript_29735:30-704(+)|eukprot:CAMPEP_0197832360 /NCGR_PEP_ID=MMETSP1437-20131217/14408_1 /TAXON_ID=49252 ORGANISM="Eucampia antarctica, Strain CCMP1452" /NCGR_SAMPLE_ID=MMETSP1437 /ASSEMBLY_ACC=CAM_ASM_001096 /LENGTH=224 /DNA_ID=CAMNT_0043435701 /DNA_START=30 /DNA_END=704 /DNA_ORIENTATION=+
MMYCTLFLFAAVAVSTASAFAPSTQYVFGARSSLQMSADSEVDFGELDGKNVRIGIIRTRWNDEHVTNLVEGARKALKETNVEDDNIFETEVPGAFELPFAAKLLALSGTVDAIICAGVLIKGDTMHFEYISDTVTSGIMSVGLQTNTPCILGVLTCLNEDQVKARSSEDNNHGYDWGKTAVEMALLKTEAMGKKEISGMGFQNATPLDLKDDKGEEKKRVGFF